MLSKSIESLVSKLTATYLSKGVQPSEIADTLFEQNYVDMKITKENGFLVMTFSFEDHDEDEYNTLNLMRYTYSEDKVLIRIEQKVGKGRYKVQWDREEDLNNTLAQILSYAKSTKEKDTLISTLPNDLKRLVSCALAA
ncbi:hypothetical protein DC897_RS16575 [Vibrio parahaemolyticus]|uniref:hypothetical protein n=1 Tax=Vibrio parahaemolyticus TaxID=670 RepID=UPI000813809A|nr:hypothetical protein [Vibrio parahaemolyticus]EGQ8311728.1 hypothetical protein [Vibrio parahaemolyticus]EGQ8852001.1 hypothetical protein [Vibrio parahaemolyticus]EGQ8856626.1 hypothetical protein [Vibrio parahaemolyticus]EGQ8876114.1 hypothetical protein [Vibrio parahaemolyticus]EGQ8995394.1 hypothetical protein [Vibrio parahaemolyticus]